MKTQKGTTFVQNQWMFNETTFTKNQKYEHGEQLKICFMETTCVPLNLYK
jgi:hypothetical protein